MHMVKVERGQRLKYSQAQKIVKEKQGDTKEICLKQYFLVESYIRAMKSADPSGTYIIEVEPCSYLPNGRQFKRLYVAWGATKAFWALSR